MHRAAQSQSPGRRRPLRVGLLGVAAVGLMAMAPTQSPEVNAAPPKPAVVAPSKQVYLVTDSVGLGAQYALPRAFPDDWQIVVDGRPAQFVEQLESRLVAPRLASNPGSVGDHVVVAGGYNYPYWSPERFDNSVDSMIQTLTAAGVKFVHWVTLREVKPEYISPSAWRQIQPYYWYFPEVNERLRLALDRHPNLSLVEWAWAADRTGVTYDAIHLNNAGAALYSSLIRQSVDAVTTRTPDGSTVRIHVPDAEGAAAAAINLTTTDPRQVGFLAAGPCGDGRPDGSVHNYLRAQTVAHSAIIPLDANGDFCVWTRSATNLIVDVTGTFATGAGFDAASPTRWLDTRERAGRVPVAAGEYVEIDLRDLTATTGLDGDIAEIAAVAISVTSTEATAPGFLRVLPCGTTSDTSNVNYLDGTASPNFVIVAPNADGKICITSRASTHVLVDLFGVFTSAAGVVTDTPVRVFDSRDLGQPVAADSVTRIDIASTLPSAPAETPAPIPGEPTPRGGVVINLTAVDAQAPGFVTAYPCAAGRPTSSNLNVSGPTAASNAAIVAPDSDGMVCVYAKSAMHLIVDLQGTLGAEFTGRTPIRVLDTRI